MNLDKIHDFSRIENDAVRLVIREMEQQLTQEEMINEEFVMDVAAFSLNHLPPLYRATLLGKVYHDNINSQEYNEKVKISVKRAIDRVRANPS